MADEYDAAEAARYAEHHPDARFVLAEDYDELNTRRMETIAMSDLLTEELARVKAESLRVVVDGKQDCVYCGGTDIECIHCYGYGKPVRLERWEKTND